MSSDKKSTKDKEVVLVNQFECPISGGSYVRQKDGSLKKTSLKKEKTK